MKRSERTYCSKYDVPAEAIGLSANRGMVVAAGTFKRPDTHTLACEMRSTPEKKYRDAQKRPNQRTCAPGES